MFLSVVSRIETGILCCMKQIAVAKSIPAFLEGRSYFVAAEKGAYRHSTLLIEEDAHQAAYAGGF